MLATTSKNKNARVGIFVSVGIFAILVSVVLFGGNSMLFSRTYTLKVPLKDVQGLGPGSLVSLAGLHIGHIYKIDFDPETNKLNVYLVLDHKYQNQITTTSVASLKTQGALGDRFVYIEPHPGVGEILKDGGSLMVQESPDLFDLISAKGNEFSNIVDVIKEVHKLLKSMNDNDRSAVFMQNMAVASQSLNSFLVEGRAALKDIHNVAGDPGLKESVARLGSIMRKIDKGEGTLGELVNNPSLHDRLLALVGENPRNKYMKSLLRQSIETEDKAKK